MNNQETVPLHMNTTETFLRLYVLLAQFLDRCRDDSAKSTFPEIDFQNHLTDTRTKAEELLATNQRVKEKVQQEFDQVINLGKVYAQGKADEATRKQVEKERETLRIKTLALSDLMAVFRSV